MTKHLVLTIFLFLAACQRFTPIVSPSSTILPVASSGPTAVLPPVTDTPLPLATQTPSLTPNTPAPTAIFTPTPFMLPMRPTVGDYLEEYQLPTSELSATFLEQRIITFNPLNNDRSFLMGYFVESPDGSFPNVLYFLRFEKATNTWFTGEVHEPERPSGQMCSPKECFGLGVVLEFIESDEFYFAHIHLNPSAGWTLILTHNLQLYDVLYGRIRQIFADGTAVYDESIIHFAPTHYALIDLYDPKTKESYRIFPKKPYQFIWLERMETVAQAYRNLDKTWCRKNNHYCAPELMNNYLASEVVVNDETDSLAFVISFSSEWRLNLPEEARAVYVYRGVHSGYPEYREVSETDLQLLFGEFELAQLLEAENLALIFTQFDFIKE